MEWDVIESAFWAAPSTLKGPMIREPVVSPHPRVVCKWGWTTISEDGDTARSGVFTLGEGGTVHTELPCLSAHPCFWYLIKGNHLTGTPVADGLFFFFFFFCWDIKFAVESISVASTWGVFILFYFILFLFHLFFWPLLRHYRSSLGQGSNPYHSSDHTGSPTRWATRELLASTFWHQENVVNWTMPFTYRRCEERGGGR